MRNLSEMNYQELIATKKHFLKLLADIEQAMDNRETPLFRMNRLAQLHKRASFKLDSVGQEMNRRAEARNFA
jgi:hypothetical protein